MVLEGGEGGEMDAEGVGGGWKLEQNAWERGRVQRLFLIYTLAPLICKW